MSSKTACSISIQRQFLLPRAYQIIWRRYDVPRDCGLILLLHVALGWCTDFRFCISSKRFTVKFQVFACSLDILQKNTGSFRCLQGVPSIGCPYAFPPFSRIPLLHVTLPPLDRAWLICFFKHWLFPPSNRGQMAVFRAYHELINSWFFKCRLDIFLQGFGRHFIFSSDWLIWFGYWSFAHTQRYCIWLIVSHFQICL